MIAEVLHVTLPIAAFVGAIYVERYKARILSVIAFWDRHSELEGTYVANWTVDLPPGTPAPVSPCFSHSMTSRKSSGLPVDTWLAKAQMLGMASTRFTARLQKTQ